MISSADKQNTDLPTDNIVITAIIWTKKNLFNSVFDTIVTVVIAFFLFKTVPPLLSWFFFDASGLFSDPETCKNSTGACWPFIREKSRFILFGTFPYEEQWRAAIASIAVISMVVIMMLKKLTFKQFMILWFIGTVTFLWFMTGYGFLTPVDTIRWNGLPVFLLLSIFSLLASFPLGVLLALARFQDNYPLLKNMATIYIEIIRGIPLLMVLFMGLFILPIVLPPGMNLEPLFATLIALTLFNAAYFAEDVRGGLQTVTKGQYEAAEALGLSYWQGVRLILLPQVFKNALPAIFNTLIGGYKDTSLVAILGIHDMLSTAKMSYGDPLWQSYGLEAYVFVGSWYFLSCFAISAYGRKLENKMLYETKS